MRKLGQLIGPATELRKITAAFCKAKSAFPPRQCNFIVLMAKFIEVRSELSPNAPYFLYLVPSDFWGISRETERGKMGLWLCSGYGCEFFR